MRRLIAPTLALLTVYGSSAAVLAAPSTLSVQMHGSAKTLEDRVSARRASRMQNKREIRQSRRKPVTTEDRTRARITRRRTVRRTRTETVDSAALRLQKRRTSRRERRLAGAPVPVKVQVVDGVNLERAKHGLQPLTHHKDLQTAAQKHAEDMNRREYFDHENPEGQRSGDRIKETGYGVINAQECNCSYRIFLGENIAKGQSSVDQVIREWMDSESHREAMLSRDYKEIGVGIIDDIWVLNFGSIEINPVGGGGDSGGGGGL